MNWILDMARRNIRRNKRRTVLAATSIALAVMLMTFLGGFVSGILDNMVRNLTRSDMGHVRVITSGFESRERFMPVDELIPNPDEVMAAIQAIPDLPGTLVTVTDRVVFGTLLSNGPNTKAAVGFAGDPDKEKGLMNLDRSVVEGRYLAGPGETILGKKLADDLGFKVGGSMLVVTQGADYGLHLKRFTIVGLFSSGLNQLDGSFFQIPVSDVKSFLRTDGGSQRILVMLDDYRKADKAAERIKEALSTLPGASSLLVQPWTEVGEYPGMIKMMEGIYSYVYIIVAMLGAFIITNILMMVVLERKREIGILKAMGLRRREVLAMFLTEGALMGAIGSGVGAALGLVICYVMSIHGIDFGAAMSSLTMPIDPIFYARFSWSTGLMTFTLGFLVSIAMSLSPSRRAAAMNAVDAIKSVA